MSIRIVESDSDLQACFPVMVQLRPHLVAAEFVDRVRRQEREGYRLAQLVDGDQVVAVAGFRFLESLYRGRFLYVDDLVTDERVRSRGFGEKILLWLIDHALEEGCNSFQLDSGVQRFAAHRFYLRNGLEIRAHHFERQLSG